MTRFAHVSLPCAAHTASFSLRRLQYVARDERLNNYFFEWLRLSNSVWGKLDWRHAWAYDVILTSFWKLNFFYSARLYPGDNAFHRRWPCTWTWKSNLPIFRVFSGEYTLCMLDTDAIHILCHDDLMICLPSIYSSFVSGSNGYPDVQCHQHILALYQSVWHHIPAGRRPLCVRATQQQQ